MILPERVRKLLVLLILTGQSVAACDSSSASAAIELFQSRYQIDDVNQTITLEPIDSGISRAARTRSVELIVRNNSGETIVFPPGFGAEGVVFESASSQWVEVSNTVQYPEVSRGLAPIDSDLPSIGIVDFLPPKEFEIGDRQLRIVVIGNVFLGESVMGRDVMAYLDVEYGDK